jgi:hypothetical protein
MDLTKPEFLAAGGALIISAGSFIYLNSKIDTIDTSVKQFGERFVTMIAKLDEHDGSIKVSKSKLSDIESLQKGLILIQNNASELRDSVSEELKLIEKTFKVQDKRIKLLEAKLEQISQSLGVIPQDLQIEDEIQIQPKIKKYKKDKIKRVNTEVKPKNAVQTDDLAASVSDEMDMLLNMNQ